jgi:hypothetical protein
MALIAAGVLTLALIVSGGRAGDATGTIVVQSFVERPGPGHLGAGPRSVSVTAIAETTGSGHLRRLLAINSLDGGLQSLFEGQAVETYVDRANTIYALTTGQLMSEQSPHRTGTGSHRSVTSSYDGTWVAPGRTSFFAVELRKHNYHVVGRTTIDGHPALKLLGDGSILSTSRSRTHVLLETAYVSPGSYDPIEESLPGFGTTVWTGYRVLPDTPANQRLLSLTSRHPTARISHSVRAYVAALERLHRR